MARLTVLSDFCDPRDDLIPEVGLLGEGERGKEEVDIDGRKMGGEKEEGLEGFYSRNSSSMTRF